MYTSLLTMIIIRDVNLTARSPVVNEARATTGAPDPEPPVERRRARALVVPLLATALVGSCVVSVGMGSYPVPLEHVLAVIRAHVFGGELDASVPPAEDTIVWALRLPRILSAALVGAALAAAGAALQAVVRNTLADPYLIGVSSGASLGAALVITLGIGSVIGAVTLAAGAFLGALLAIALVLLLARSRRQLSSGRLVLAGITVSYFLAAITNLVVVLSDSRDAVRAVLFWTLGSLSRSTWIGVPVLAAATLVCVLTLTVWSRRLDAISLGDDVARSLGTDPGRLRLYVVLLSSLGVAAAVSVSGSIGFVGLVVPHLARRLVGAAHRLVIPTSALLGGVLLVWADALARTVLAPREIPLGILTALVGTPLLMALVRRQLTRTTPTRGDS